MKGSEFLKKIKKIGKVTGVPVRYSVTRGKGSHGLLYFGDKVTTLRNLKDELKTGTYHAMLKQLGLTELDFVEYKNV